MARRHRIITVPSGLILFACIVLPGYSECGEAASMSQNPGLAGCCVVGLFIAAAALAFVRGSAEFPIVIVSLIWSTLVVSLLGVGAFSWNEVYAGVSIGVAAASVLLTGVILWLLEHRGRNIRIGIVAAISVLGLLAIVTTARLSTWTPTPDRPKYDYSKLPIVVH